RRIEALQVERGIIEREGAIGVDVTDRATRVQQSLVRETAALEELRAAWAREKEGVDEILALRAKLREATGKADAPPGSSAAAKESDRPDRQTAPKSVA